MFCLFGDLASLGDDSFVFSKVFVVVNQGIKTSTAFLLHRYLKIFHHINSIYFDQSHYHNEMNLKKIRKTTLTAPFLHHSHLMSLILVEKSDL
jgi:hypothetical protein